MKRFVVLGWMVLGGLCWVGCLSSDDTGDGAAGASGSSGASGAAGTAGVAGLGGEAGFGGEAGLGVAGTGTGGSSGSGSAGLGGAAGTGTGGTAGTGTGGSAGAVAAVELTVDTTKYLDELSTPEIENLCGWSAYVQGGPGEHECPDGNVTVNSAEVCAERMASTPVHCQVSLATACIDSAIGDPCLMGTTSQCEDYLTCVMGG